MGDWLGVLPGGGLVGSIQNLRGFFEGLFLGFILQYDSGHKILFGRAFHQYLIMARFFRSSWEKNLEAFSFLLKNVFLVGVSSDVFTNVWPNLLP